MGIHRLFVYVDKVLGATGLCVEGHRNREDTLSTKNKQELAILEHGGNSEVSNYDGRASHTNQTWACTVYLKKHADEIHACEVHACKVHDAHLYLRCTPIPEMYAYT